MLLLLYEVTIAKLSVVVKDDLDVPIVEDSDCLFLPLNELWADPPSSCPLVAVPVHSLVAYYPFDVDIIPSVQDYGNAQHQLQQQGVLVSCPPASRSSPPSGNYWTKSPEMGYQSSASKSKNLSGSGSEDTLVQNQQSSEWENLPPVENPKAKRLLSTKLPLRPVLGAKGQKVQQFESMNNNGDVSMSTNDHHKSKNNEGSDVNNKKRQKEKRSVSKSKGGKKEGGVAAPPWCENAELFDLLSDKQSDSSLFKQVYDILRTYGWSYRYSGLAVLFLKPHAVKQKVADLVLGKDGFDSEEALLEGLCQEMDIPYLRETGSRKTKGKDLSGDLVILSSRASTKSSYQRPPRLTAKKKILGDTNIKALERRRSSRETAKASIKKSLSEHESPSQPDFSSLSESSPFEKIETSDGDDSPTKGNCSSSSGYFENSSRSHEAKEVKRRLFPDEKPAKKKKKSSNAKDSQQQGARNKRSHKRKSGENEDDEEEVDDEVLSSQSSVMQHDSDSDTSPRPVKKAKSANRMVDIGHESALLCPPASAYQGDLRAYIHSMISHMEDDTYFNTHLPFPVPGRIDETIYLFNHIMHSLRTGKGKMIYIAGHPGGGKSQTVEITLMFLNRLFNKHHPPKQSPIQEEDVTTATKKATRFGSSTIPSDSETTTASSKARSFSRFINVQEENDHHCFHIIRANAMRLDGMNTLKHDLNTVCNLFSEEDCTADRLRDHFVEFPAHDCELPWTSLEVDYQHYLGLNMFSQNIKRHLPPTSSMQRLPPNFTSNRSADILSAAEGVKGKRKEKYRTYPMVILFIDEIDKLSGKVYDKLFEMTKGRLIVVGTGNTVHSILPDDASLIAMATGSVDEPTDSGVVLNPSSFQYSSAIRVCSMIFNPYEVSDFEAILAFRTGDCFSSKALELLAKKIKQRGNGDVRALLNWAVAAMKKALEKHVASKAADPVSVMGFISPVHILQTEASPLDHHQKEAIKALPFFPLLMAVALIVHQNGLDESFSMTQARAAHNSYLHSHNFNAETMFACQQHMENLLQYQVIKRINPLSSNDKAIYRVNCNPVFLLEAPLLLESHKNELRAFLERRERLKRIDSEIE
eukprot:scaffold8015_cov165-Ochromonas_danica.AAC.37